MSSSIKVPSGWYCANCGAEVMPGEDHMCGNFRMMYSEDMALPPKRILVGGYWYALEKPEKPLTPDG